MESSSEPKYTFLEHTTDAEIEAYGSSIDEAFANAALALEDTMVDLNTIEPAKGIQFTLSGRDAESLLYFFLEKLIVLEETDGLIFSRFDCKINSLKEGYELAARAWGEEYDPTKHQQKTAIKAPTYYAMKIGEKKFDGRNKVAVHFLLDL